MHKRERENHASWGGGKAFKQIRYGVSITTANRHLRNISFSVKAVRFEPERANSPENKSNRAYFVRKLLAYQSAGMQILYMDETNFNLHISRRDGGALRGTRATAISAGSKGPNVHMIGCIGSPGLIHHLVRRGSFTKNIARDWMRGALRAAKEKYGTPVVMIIDNAPSHTDIESIILEE